MYLYEWISRKLLVTAGDVWNYWQNIQILNILFGVLTYSMLWKTFHCWGLVSSWNVPKPLLTCCLFCPLETWNRRCTMSSRILIQVSFGICLCMHWDILLSLLASTCCLLGVNVLIVQLCCMYVPANVVYHSMVQIVRDNIWYDVIFLLCMEYCDYNWDHIVSIQVPLIYPSVPFFLFFPQSQACFCKRFHRVEMCFWETSLC